MKPVSKKVRKSLPLLKFIARERDPRLRADHLRKLGGDLTVFDALGEISENYLNDKIKLSPGHSKIISKKKNIKTLKKLTCQDVRKDCHQRNKVLEQTGGFLPFLIPAAATVIDLVLSKYLQK